MRNSDVLTDDSGESIGSVSNYVARFKKIDSGEDVSYKPDFKKMEKKIITLPSEWKAETEKEILLHYYKRFGDLSCTDFQTVSIKLASNINRLFQKNLTAEDIAQKLKIISIEDLKEGKEDVPKENISLPKKARKISMLETSYDYKKGLPPLDTELYEMIPFVDPKKICFSSDDFSLYLAIKPGHEKCFEDIFDFTPKEQMMFNLFRDQLGNELNAKKLVLMTRSLNSDYSTPNVPLEEKTTPLKKLISKKKTK